MRPIIPPPIQGLLIAAGMWGIAQAFPATDFNIPAQSVIAIGLILTGICIELAAVAAFFKAKTTVNPLAPEKANTLVVQGLFNISRNPMYLGMALLLAGWAFSLGNLLSFTGPVLFMTLITLFQIKPEEKALTEKFGAPYIEYCNKVRRWL